MGVISQLDVVNGMLALVGETPANSLSDSYPLIAAGLAAIKVASVRELTRGWWFNTETVTLAATADGSVMVPDDILKIDPTDTSLAYVQRGNRLRNTQPVSGTTSPYFIGKDVEVRVVLNIPFDDLPAPAQLLVQYSAQLEFSADFDADPEKVAKVGSSYKAVLVELNAEHTRSLGVNMLRNPSVVATLGLIMPANRAGFAR